MRLGWGPLVLFFAPGPVVHTRCCGVMEIFWAPHGGWFCVERAGLNHTGGEETPFAFVGTPFLLGGANTGGALYETQQEEEAHHRGVKRRGKRLFLGETPKGLGTPQFLILTRAGLHARGIHICYPRRYDILERPPGGLGSFGQAHTFGENTSNRGEVHCHKIEARRAPRDHQDQSLGDEPKGPGPESVVAGTNKPIQCGVKGKKGGRYRTEGY